MYNQILLCNKNLAGVLLMCERHPPTSFTLIDMLEEKINVCKTTMSGTVFCIQYRHLTLRKIFFIDSKRHFWLRT